MAILNAGDGHSDHPTQGLLDVFTIYQNAIELDKPLEEMVLGIIGDIKHSRVAESTIYIAHLFGVPTYLIAPALLLPSERILSAWKTGLGVKIEPDLNKILPRLDVAMALRLQKERLQIDEKNTDLEALVTSLQLTESRLNQFAHPKLMVMHPGPVNWGVELGSCLAGRHHKRTRIHQQVQNGVAIRKACLLWALLP
jgi:aspartate carbamoyltransferase catalytic subunit